MRRLSIRLRVTLWFTLFMLVLAGLMLLFLFSVGEYVVLSGSQDTLTTVVERSFREIEYDDGELDIDDDLDYFQNGVYVAVYDGQGRLLYGRLPTGFPQATTLTDGGVRSVSGAEEDWYVYDRMQQVGSYTVWVRGVLSSAGSGGTFTTLTRLAMVAFPFLVLLAAVGGYFLVARAFRPVKKLAETAEQIGSGDDLRRRIDLGEGKDEIYALAATFDRMLDRLQGSFERERQFTADASHELRTPTAVIIAQCEYALEEAKTPEEYRAALETVLEQAQRMSTLIAQLLTLSRGDRGQANLHLEALNFSELTEMVSEQIRETAEKRQIQVFTDIQPDLLLRGDETMLMRMLLNLMENGVKYGREGGHLWVHLEKQGRDIVGRVRDDGIGIAPEHLDKIWERFYQVDTARSPAREGAGLGLSMVKYIVQAHGGSIGVESTPGEGTEFIFRLPAEDVSPAA